jgi:hypothetical protein
VPQKSVPSAYASFSFVVVTARFSRCRGRPLSGTVLICLLPID